MYGRFETAGHGPAGRISARLFRVTYPDDLAVHEMLASSEHGVSITQRDATVDAFADAAWYGQTEEGHLAEKRLYELKRSFECWR